MDRSAQVGTGPVAEREYRRPGAEQGFFLSFCVCVCVCVYVCMCVCMGFTSAPFYHGPGREVGGGGLVVGVGKRRKGKEGNRGRGETLSRWCM